MPFFQLQSREGKLFEIEAPDINAAESAMQERLSAASKPLDMGKLPRDVGAGLVRGARDVPDAGAQLLTHGLESLAPEGSWFHRYMQGQRELVERINKEAEEDYQKNWRGGGASDVGRVGGNLIAAAPIAAAMPGAAAASLPARIGSGALGGGVTGALQPVDTSKTPDFWGEKATQTGVGAAGGAIAPTVTGPAARVVAPNLSPQIRQLLGEGVTLTPGQVAGKTFGRVEEGLQSIPFVGDVVTGARTRAIESFDRAAIDRALAPIGQRLPANTPMGRPAIDAAHDAVTSAYDRLLPQLNVRADPQFANNVSTLWQNAQFLEPDQLRTLSKVLQDKVLHRFAPNGGMTGNDFKTIESELGRLGKNYSSSADAGQRELGGALRQVQAEMRDLLVRSNPNHSDELRSINTAYANLVRVEGAAGKQGAEEGVFTPAQLLNAVRGADPSIRKGSFARGEALMQDLADAGKTVMGSKVPDSGTPYRHFLALPALAGLGGGAGYMAGGDPGSSGAGAALGGLALGSAYTRPGAAALRTLIASRPSFAPQIASILRRPEASTLAAILAQSPPNP